MNINFYYDNIKYTNLIWGYVDLHSFILSALISSTFFQNNSKFHGAYGWAKIQAKRKVSDRESLFY